VLPGVDARRPRTFRRCEPVARDRELLLELRAQLTDAAEEIAGRLHLLEPRVGGAQRFARLRPA
jgi:hypothetical protein